MSEWDDEPSFDINEERAAPVPLAEVRPVPGRRMESPEVRSKGFEGKNPVMAEMGRSGGHARTVALSPERRREIARLGGLARAAGKRR